MKPSMALQVQWLARAVALHNCERHHCRCSRAAVYRLGSPPSLLSPLPLPPPQLLLLLSPLLPPVARPGCCDAGTAQCGHHVASDHDGSSTIATSLQHGRAL